MLEAHGCFTNPKVREQKAKRNAERVIGLENAMFDWRSRHLLINLTLTYLKEYRAYITFDTIRQHRDQLLNNRRSNELLSGIDGYVWKIESGPDAGLHLHLIIFYDGSRRGDIYIAQCIGEYWVKMTGGWGDYRNSNAQKAMHALYGHGVGTGQINRHDCAARDALRINLLYLAKDDQIVFEREGAHERTFGTSQFP